MESTFYLEETLKNIADTTQTFSYKPGLIPTKKVHGLKERLKQHNQSKTVDLKIPRPKKIYKKKKQKISDKLFL